MRAFALFFDRFSSILNRIALWGAVAAVLIMAFSASWQVFARYLLDAPPVWTEELSRRAMVWAGMLGASAAFRLRADPTLFPAMVKIQGGLGIVLSFVRGLGVTLFAVPVIWYSLFGANMNMSFGFLGRSLSRTAEMLPISMIWFTSAVPIAFTLIMIHMIAGLMLRLNGLEIIDDNTDKELK